MKTRDSINLDSTEKLVNHLDTLRKWYESEYKEKGEKLCAMEESDFAETQEGYMQIVNLTDECETLYETANKINALIELIEHFI